MTFQYLYLIIHINVISWKISNLIQHKYNSLIVLNFSFFNLADFSKYFLLTFHHYLLLFVSIFFFITLFLYLSLVFYLFFYHLNSYENNIEIEKKIFSFILRSLFISRNEKKNYYFTFVENLLFLHPLY